jgi:hypothetical protein
MSVNNITRRFQELKDNRSFARVFRGPTWIQVGFGEPPKPARQRRALPRLGNTAPFFPLCSFACFAS